VTGEGRGALSLKSLHNKHLSSASLVSRITQCQLLLEGLCFRHYSPSLHADGNSPLLSPCLSHCCYHVRRYAATKAHELPLPDLFYVLLASPTTAQQVLCLPIPTFSSHTSLKDIPLTAHQWPKSECSLDMASILML
jgi:hypothetical protein